MNPELKALLDDFNKTFAEFKVANDKRLDEIAATGRASAETTSKVDKMNAALTDAQQKIEELQTTFARFDATGGRTNDVAARAEQAHARAFFARIHDCRPEDLPDSKIDMPQYRAYRSAFSRYLRVDDKISEVRNAMSVGSDPAGGYLVPPDLSGRIIELIRETSPMRSLAAIVTTASDRFGGLRDLDEVSGGGWVTEQAARPQTNAPLFGKYEILVHEQYEQPGSTQQLLDDASTDIEAFLARKVADKLGRRENTAFVLGSGVGQPRGFLTYAAGTPSSSTFNVILQRNTGVNGGFHATTPGDVLIDTVFGLKPAYRNGAQWVMSRTTEAAVRKIKDGQGNYLWQPNFQLAGAATLLGFGITNLEDMPVLATGSLSIGFGNWREAYQIIDRIGIRMLRDPFTAKPYVLFYTTKRVGGDVVNFDAISLVKFAT